MLWVVSGCKSEGQSGLTHWTLDCQSIVGYLQSFFFVRKKRNLLHLESSLFYRARPVRYTLPDNRTTIDPGKTTNCYTFSQLASLWMHETAAGIPPFWLGNRFRPPMRLFPSATRIACIVTKE